MRGTILDGPFELSRAARAARRARSSRGRYSRRAAAPAARAAGVHRPAATIRDERRRRLGPARPHREAAAPAATGRCSSTSRATCRARRSRRRGRSRRRRPRRAPTRVRLEIPGTRVNDVTHRIGQRARAAALRRARRRPWRLERGAARFDAQPVALPAQPGLLVTGDWPQFDLGEWLALRTRPGGSTSIGGQRLMDWLGPVDVHLDRATVFGFEFRDVIAQAAQRRRRSGGSRVTGPEAEGR